MADTSCAGRGEFGRQFLADWLRSLWQSEVSVVVDGFVRLGEAEGDAGIVGFVGGAEGMGALQVHENPGEAVDEEDGELQHRQQRKDRTEDVEPASELLVRLLVHNLLVLGVTKVYNRVVKLAVVHFGHSHKHVPKIASPRQLK